MKKSNDSRIGSIYLAKVPGSGFLKIGSAMNGLNGINRRLKILSTSHVDDFRLLGYIDGVRSPLMVEHEIHRKLGRYQMKNSKGQKKEIFKISVEGACDLLGKFAESNGLTFTKTNEYGPRSVRYRNLSRNTKKVITHIESGNSLTFKTWKTMAKFLGMSHQSTQEAFMEGRNLRKVWKPTVVTKD